MSWAAWGFRSRKSVEVGFLDILPRVPCLEMPRASLVATLPISCYPMIFPLSLIQPMARQVVSLWKISYFGEENNLFC